jgi:hypothetical protein
MPCRPRKGCVRSAGNRRVPPLRDTAIAAVVAVIVIAASACGGAAGPAAPRPAPDFPARWVQPGAHILYVTGFDLSPDRSFPICQPFGVPRSGRSIKTRVMVSREGDEIVIRPIQAVGSTLLVRFRHESAAGLRHVSGSALGCAADEEYLWFPVTDVRFCAAGESGATARLTGQVSLEGSVMTGRLDGLLTFTDSAGASGRCPAVGVTLSRN